MKRISSYSIFFLALAESADSLSRYFTKLRPNHQSHHTSLQMRLNPTSFEGTSFTITEFPRPSLRRVPNAPITVFDDTFQTKAREMVQMMYPASAVGIAAPQVGLNEDFFVYNPTGDKRDKNLERIVCNPKVTKYSDETAVEEEACLSLRNNFVAGNVKRSVWIQVEYQNELGQKTIRRLKGFEARVFQHEYDHLQGILCYDRFAPEDRQKVQKNMDTLLGLYRKSDAIVEPNPESLEAMQPPPLTALNMPPMEEGSSAQESPKKKKKKVVAKTGFGGASGFGGGDKKRTANKKKKKQ